MSKGRFSALLAPLFLLFSASAHADAGIDALRAEIAEMRQAYESRIADLEAKVSELERSRGEGQVAGSAPAPAPAAPATAGREVKDNSFNPSIGLVLNGQYSKFSAKEGEVAGFAVGEEGERPGEGFAVDHTELNFSANVDDKFYGSVTAALAEHDGSTEVELEEAYVQTLPGSGLPDGVSVKAGRAYWTLGYLNEHHSHVDDFADRPLPYRVFLNSAYNDDGAEVSYLLPTEVYSEIGGGVFRGDDFPFGASDGNGFGAFSVFARVGGDAGDNSSWRAGGYVLSGDAAGGRTSGHEGEQVSFTGDTRLYAADVRYVWAPSGNPLERELIFQGEYFHRDEDGMYDPDAGGPETAVDFDESSNGWYAQTVYKFARQWRLGARYSRLGAHDVPSGLAGTALDPGGYDPKAYALMLDWTNSEFSRLRLQYNREELARGEHDNQLMLQYIMSIGAHGAHKY